jgi:hypothetical protein
LSEEKFRTRGGIGEKFNFIGREFTENSARTAQLNKKLLRDLPLKIGYAQKNLREFNRKVLIHSAVSICLSSRNERCGDGAVRDFSFACRFWKRFRRLNSAKVCLGYHPLVRNSRFKNQEVRQRVERRWMG